ncbi:hypothetical protein [Streptomyces sp. NPDC026673]|uniref:hypothetical protein n=1 Tax=Streptomyces sp. NPDC026673 TaxID=3155724 RepID=UPI0033F91BDD
MSRSPSLRDRHRPQPRDAGGGAFTAGGFRISVISEPQPVPAVRELFRDEFHTLSARTGFPFLVLETT